MRRILLLMAAVAVSFSAIAEGYQTNNFSARQSGMANVGTGMNLGAESVWFNPAAVVMQESLLDVSAGLSGIIAKHSYANDLLSATTGNDFTMPFNIYASVRPFKWLAVGVALNTPNSYNINWGDGWAGAHICQNMSLNQYNFQPTLSVRLGEKLSVGAGMMVTWGNFNFSRSLLAVGASTNAFIEQMSGIPALGDVIGSSPLASIELSGKATPAIGFNVGLFWDVNKIFSLGVTYRHPIRMKVEEGSASLRFIENEYLGAAAETMLDRMAGLSNDVLSQSTIATELVTPGSIALGVSLHPFKILDISADLQYNLWSSYKEQRIYMNTPSDTTELTNDVTAQRGYKNSFTARLGVQLSPLGWISARAGISFDESPVKDDVLMPNVPSMSKIGVTAGLSLRFFRLIFLDLAYGYTLPVEGGRTGSTQYTNMLTQQAELFSGTYSGDAHTFSVGLRLSF